MDFEDSPEEAAFRAEVRAFLDANAERKSAAQPVLRLRAIDAAEISAPRNGRRRKRRPGLPG